MLYTLLLIYIPEISSESTAIKQLSAGTQLKWKSVWFLEQHLVEKKKKVDKVGRTDMKKKYKITQPKPLLLPLRFTEMFQTSEVSYNFIYLFLQIHSKMPPKGKHWHFPYTGILSCSFDKHYSWMTVTLKPLAQGWLTTMLPWAQSQKNDPALCFTTQGSWKLCPLLHPFCLSFLLVEKGCSQLWLMIGLRRLKITTGWYGNIWKLLN